MKHCPKCNQTKHYAEFYRSKQKPDGHYGWCIVCCKTHKIHAARKVDVAQCLLSKIIKRKKEVLKLEQELEKFLKEEASA